MNAIIFLTIFGSGSLWHHFSFVYINNLLIASATPEELLRHQWIVFERLIKFGIVINSNKCLFGVNELEFLAHQIDRNGIISLQDKIQAVQAFPLPGSQCKLQQFFGLLNFYHRFLPHCAKLMQSLHALLVSSKPKSQMPTWNDTILVAFNATKETLANATLLHYPTSNASTCLMTDASETTVRAVLQQYVDDIWHPIFFPGNWNLLRSPMVHLTGNCSLCISLFNTFVTSSRVNIFMC